MKEPSGPALGAIRAWYQLERAFDRARQHLQSTYGITGEQLAVLRILAEQKQWKLTDLRSRLTMHPATLGQILERMRDKELVHVSLDPHDRRRRVISVTKRAHELCQTIPVIGPVRLRSTDADPLRLDRLAVAFSDAIQLFGLEDFACEQTKKENTLA